MSFTYDDAFPDRWLHADDLQGKPWTLTISKAYDEKLRGPAGDEETCYILSFEGRKREYILNKTNAFVLVKLWGRNSDDWLGHQITLAPKDDSRSPTGKRIVFIGTPEIDEPLRLTLPGGEHRTISPTKAATKRDADPPLPDPKPHHMRSERRVIKDEAVPTDDIPFGEEQ